RSSVRVTIRGGGPTSVLSMHGPPSASDLPARYELRVGAALDPRWSAWFDDMEIAPESDEVTIIAGDVMDQAALHGLLAKVRDLGLRLLDVRRVDKPAREL